MIRKIRMAMIGGGNLDSIGPMHALGAQLSGSIELVAGVFSRNNDKNLQAAARYGVDPDRCYSTPEAFFAAEHPRDDRIDFVTIATTNQSHFTIAVEALATGMHIFSDKPPTATLAQALALQQRLEGSNCLYALAFVNTGQAMLREARARVSAGQIGKVRRVVVTYAQDWLAFPVERSGHAGAAWRTDPNQSGVGGCSADIGIHAFNLAEFVSGQTVTEICAATSSLVDGRQLDDDCNALLRFDNGASGVLATSQVAFGDRNTIAIAVYGDAGAISWSNERADELRLVCRHEMQIIQRHCGEKLTEMTLSRRFGNEMIAGFTALYMDFARAIRGETRLIDRELPGILAGVRAMRFIEGAVNNSARHQGWQRIV
ncbi:Gfo/Idh/MocA family protein [Novosphingobium mathurense]|uniref:Predicted dehydrogenase n=1 Tax=Novosphingobium mathurense TaxID=428990 RepID=A0A1U6ILZ7_9SPHN|nr:Gfo/Idh/MocA family oxidoreductase [Novosphingobium mathurense]SLK09030.1 Predicted dehydrogenase [Novosphingobium mathurense]